MLTCLLTEFKGDKAMEECTLQLASDFSGHCFLDSQKESWFKI